MQSLGYYTTADVARLAGLTPHRVARWARMGIIRHSVSSRPNVYSYADVGEAILAHYLFDQGKPPRKIKVLVENLRTDYGEWPLAAAPLEHDGPLCVVWDENDEAHVSVDIPGQKVMEKTLLNLREIREALKQGGWVSLKNPRIHVEIDPDRHSGEPVIKGRRLSTQRVANLAAEPSGRIALHKDFDLTDDQIDDAIGYERDIAELVPA